MIKFIGNLSIFFLLLVSPLLGNAQFRHLFIDTTKYESNLKRVHHYPSQYSGNPILTPDKSWELNAHGDPYAAPFSGGVWIDPADGKFKMWYSAGGGKKLGMVTCYAESADGIHWIKPSLDVVKGTNIVDTCEHDCVSVLLDAHEKDSSKKFKMFIMEFNSTYSVSMLLKYSSDGIHWSKPAAVSGELLDRCSVYYDPYRQQYVLSLKSKINKIGRARNYLAHSDPEMAVSLAHKVFHNNNDKYVKPWFVADKNDPRNPNFPDIVPQIYNHDAIAYEGMILGQFVVWQGPENKDCDKLNIQKRNEILLGWSEDGFNWIREDFHPFIGVNEDPKAWNAGNVQSVCGSPLIVGDSLYFYYSARYNSKPVHDSNFSTGVAMLRRDGFVSLDADKSGGYVLTDTFTIENDNRLFVNIDASHGEIAAEILSEDGKALPGFEKSKCASIKASDKTRVQLKWKGCDNLSLLMGQKVRIRFYVKKASLYSWWLEPSAKVTTLHGFPTEELGIHNGLSACYSGVLNGKLIVAGGCNFPMKGHKKYYKGIYAAELSASDILCWKQIGELPCPSAYGVSVNDGKELIIAGGRDSTSSHRDVFRLSLEADEATIETLPQLPFAIDNAAGTMLNGVLYIAGGNVDGKPSKKMFALDLKNLERGWMSLPGFPGMPRVQPVMASNNGSIYVFGGYFQNGSESQVATDGLCYHIKSKTWKHVPAPVDEQGHEITLTGGTMTQLKDGEFFAVGGVNKTIFQDAISDTYSLVEKASYLEQPVEWYQFNPYLLKFNTSTNQWQIICKDQRLSRAGATITTKGGNIYIVAGETKPSVRSSEIQKVELH